jgi:hypothetical protein
MSCGCGNVPCRHIIITNNDNCGDESVTVTQPLLGVVEVTAVGPRGASGPAGSSGTSGVNGSSGSSGTSGVNGASYPVGYGSFYSTTTQPLLSTTNSQIVKINNSWTSNGVTLSGDGTISFTEAGTYQLTYVVQLTNSANSVEDAYFWVKYMGNNFPNSNTQLSMSPRKSPSFPSSQLATVCILGVAQNDGDYIELYWAGTSTSLTLAETAAQTSPVAIPETPSVILSVIRIS